MMKLIKQLLLTLAAVSLLAACGPGKSKQQKLKEEEQHDFIKSLPKTDYLNPLWSRKLGEFNEIGFDFVIDNGVSYSIDAEGLISAIDIESSKVIWRKKSRHEIVAGIAVGPDTLFAVDHKARLLAFNRENGEQRWQTQLDGEVLIPPVYAAGYAIIKTLDARLVAFNVDTGEPVWTYRHTKPGLSLRGGSTPVVERNFLFTGFADGRLIAIDAFTGNLLWDVPVGKSSGRDEIQRLTDIDARPIIEGNDMYVSAFQRRTLALDIVGGSVLWSQPFSSFRDLAIDSRALYLIGATNKIIALNRATGNPVWAIENLDEENFTAIKNIDGRLLVTNDDGLALIINSADGEILGREKFPGDQPLNQPSVVNGVAYTLSADGKLRAFRMRQ